MLISCYRKAILICLLIFFQAQLVAAADFVSVKTKKAFLFEGPSESTKKELIITEGYPLLIVVMLKDWLKVKDHEGKITWIKSIDTSSSRTVMILKNNTAFYSEPSSNSIKLGEADANVTLTLLSPSDTDGWIHVKSEYQDMDGFVSKNDIWGI